MQLGWIKIHRSLLGHRLAKDPLRLGWWVIMLLSVNREDRVVNLGGEMVECKRGQSLMSLLSWADKFGIKGSEEARKSAVRRFFNDLKTDTMIDTITTRKTTRLTICNYDTYQSQRNDSDTITDTMSDTITDTNTRSKEVNKKRSSYEDPKNETSEHLEDLGSSENQSNTPTDPNLEKEKGSAKKEKVNFRAKLIEIGVTAQTADDWLQVRKVKQAVNTLTALTKIVSQLRIAYKAGHPPEECIRAAAENSWAGFNAKWLENLRDNEGSNTTRQPTTRATTEQRAENYAAGLAGILAESEPTAPRL